MGIRTILSIHCFSFLLYGAISLEEYAEKLENIDLVTHRIHTLNQTGSAMCFSTELTEAFLEHCQESLCTSVLEVGCAFGIKASQIVQTGVFLTANDIEPRHLEIMKTTFSELAKNNPFFANVEYLPGDIAAFKQENLGDQKYDAVLCESVLHFLYPEEFRRALGLLFTSLKPGGKIYLTVLSGYLEDFRAVFEKNKLEGLEWPGLFKNCFNPRIPYHVFDLDTLVRELEHVGFSIQLCKYIPKSFLEKEYQYDERDWVIAIAKKPILQ